MSNDLSFAHDDAKRELHEWQIAEIRKGLAEAGGGGFASDEDAGQTLKQWKSRRGK